MTHDKETNVTKDQLVEHLHRLGLRAGDAILFHASLKSIGHVEPGPEAVIEALLEVVGPKGTLIGPTLVPAFQGIRPVFDPQQTPSEMGRLTEVLRTWPGALRSDHPTHSVAALGNLAEEITADHYARGWGPKTPWGRNAVGFDSPWDRLTSHDASVLLIGVDFDRCTLLHHVQVRYVETHEGITEKTPWPEFDFLKMGHLLDAAAVVQHGRLGNADCLLVRAQDIVESGLKILETRPEEIFTDPRVNDWRSLRSHIQSKRRPQAATFKVEVTPRDPDCKIARPLHIRGLLIDHPQDGRAALLLWDHLHLYESEGDQIRRAVAEATGTPHARVLLTATHTHCGYGPDFPPDSGYVAWVAGRAAVAAQEAMRNMEPVRAGWTSVSASGICRNRTVYLKDGRAYTERWILPSTWHVPRQEILRRGPKDEELRILVLERLDRTRLAVFANFSCHNSAALQDEKLGDDFFGVAMETVDRAEGNGCVTLVTPGSQGDQDPTAMIELGGDRNLAYARRLGQRLAGYLLVAIQEIEMHDLFDLSMSTEQVEVTVRKDWQEGAREFQHPEQIRRVETGTAPAEITAFAIGQFAVVGIPAEIFTSTARTIREHSPFELTSVMGLTNGSLFYVPEKDAYFNDSHIYGVTTDAPAMVEPGSDAILAEAACRCLRLARTNNDSKKDERASS